MSMTRAVSVRDALDGARTAIAAGGSPSAALDAELLLADALGVPRAQLHADPAAPVTGPAVRRFQSHVRRRSIDREPVAYIVGRRGFRALEIVVDGRVLIPRPETELLVELALELPSGSSVLDCCCGRGRSRSRSPTSAPISSWPARTSIRTRWPWRAPTASGSSSPSLVPR